jgi:cystathionine gamma-synthase
MRLETLAVHAGAERDATGAVAPPIHLSTTFEHPPDASTRTGHLYARYGNPTEERLERALAALEGGTDAVVYGSGMAAGAALLGALPPGAHVVLAADCYFTFRTIALEFGSRWGIETTVVDHTDLTAVRGALRPTTRLIWTDTPSNPRLDVVDLAALAAIAREAGALLAVDNTFATPVLQHPLGLGADVALHSLTKSIGGHSDVQAGALVVGDAPAARELGARLRRERTLLGPVAAPLSAWLVLRGLRSLPCRMAWACRSAQAIAEALAEHPAVARVHYPGLRSHPGHAIAARQMTGGFGAVLSFVLRGGRPAALAVVQRLALITSATSLGGVETLVEHRASVEGAGSPTDPGLLRIAVGLEHVDDLLEDLRAALG